MESKRGTENRREKETKIMNLSGYVVYYVFIA